MIMKLLYIPDYYTFNIKSHYHKNLPAKFKIDMTILNETTKAVQMDEWTDIKRNEASLLQMSYS